MKILGDWVVKIKHRARGANDSSEGDCDVTTFHSSLPTPESPLRGGGGESRAGTEVLRDPDRPGESGPLVLGGKRRGPTPERVSRGSPAQSHPGATGEGGGWAAGGRDRLRRLWVGERQGAPRGSPCVPQGQHRLWPRPGRRRGLWLGQGAATRHILPFSWQLPICSVGFLPTFRYRGRGRGATSPSSVKD